MSKVADIKLKLKDIIDPSANKTLNETKGIKHVGIDEENNTVVLIIKVQEKTPEITKTLTREIAKVVKIDLGFKGLKIEFEQEKATVTKGPKTLFIASGKGGVGKSTVTANLAYALKRMGKKVAVIDADIYGANMPKIFGIDKHQLMGTDDGKVYPLDIDNIQMMSTEFLVEKNRALMLRGPMLNKVLKLFFEDTVWRNDIEYFLVDLPPGTGDVMMDLEKFVKDGKMVIVTTPQENASHIAIKAGYAAKDLHQDVIGVIENMSFYEINGEKHYIFGKDGGKRVSDELMVELLAELPITPKDKSIYEETEYAGMLYLNLARKIIDLL
jgi:ATP-binding protein involved in chromosome partitioning